MLLRPGSCVAVLRAGESSSAPLGCQLPCVPVLSKFSSPVVSPSAASVAPTPDAPAVLVSVVQQELAAPQELAALQELEASLLA